METVLTQLAAGQIAPYEAGKSLSGRDGAEVARSLPAISNEALSAFWLGYYHGRVQARGGLSTSPAKQAASRANGRKGGRPRRKDNVK